MNETFFHCTLFNCSLKTQDKFICSPDHPYVVAELTRRTFAAADRVAKEKQKQDELENASGKKWVNAHTALAEQSSGLSPSDVFLVFVSWESANISQLKLLDCSGFTEMVCNGH